MRQQWTGWLALALLTVSPAASAQNGVLIRDYVEQTTLVLKARDVVERRVPFRLMAENGSVIDSGQLLRDCATIRPQPRALIIYQPASRNCTSLTQLLTFGVNKAWNAAGLRGLRYDEAEFIDRLEANSVVHIEPRLRHVFRGQVCYCPIEPEPDSIFKNGFEGLAAYL